MDRKVSRMTRRSPEQVHDEDGHAEFVASCKRCQTEAEADQNAEEARAELAADGDIPDEADTVVGDQDADEVTAAEDRTVLGTVETFDGEQVTEGPLPDADPAGYPDDAEELPVQRVRRALTTDGRPKCYIEDCPLPEFMEDAGLCGGHWSNRPDLRKAARNG